ncbi:MAG: tetratricopeptide repeat protein [Magnetococcales bacterium]|nr:tetratricopeptide repeat protein [Magnetococcales bacterium]
MATKHITLQQMMATAFQLHQAGRLQEANTLYQQVLAASPRHADALHLSGLLARQTGDLHEAARLIQKGLEANPNMAPAYINLGSTLLDLGQLQQAITALEKGITLQPDVAESHNNLGNALARAGRHADAEKHYEKALTLRPDYAAAHNNLGNLLRQHGHQEEAIARFRRAIALDPNYPPAHNNLGNALLDQGDTDGAIQALHTALNLQPQLLEAHINLGSALRKKGHLDEAIEALNRALNLAPNDANALTNLGAILTEQGHPHAAIEQLKRALTIAPDLANAHNNLGNALALNEDIDGAIISYQNALSLKPDHILALQNLGNAQRNLGAMAEAERLLHKAHTLSPDHASILHHLGLTQREQGHPKLAVETLRRALALQPDDADIHASLLFTLDLTPGVPTAIHQQERRLWAEHFAPQTLANMDHPNDRNPDRKLRIGYVSADFRSHSAAAAFGAALIYHNRESFEVYAYANDPRQDEVTERFQQAVHAWRPIRHLSDEAAAQLIRQDRIDLLVDLSGHSPGHRMALMARKCAPIQATGWGYILGTGLSAMDALFIDPDILPVSERPLFAEGIADLPCAVSYLPLNTFPDVGPLPAGAHGHITFGSFHRTEKINHTTLDLWAKTLMAVENSRLLIKLPKHHTDWFADYYRTHMARFGVTPERLMFQGRSDQMHHLSQFNQVDIGLDPLPHCGGITSLELLRMGVPVISLMGETIPGRLGRSFCRVMDMEDWWADSEEGYIAIAVEKSRDRAALIALRAALRSRFDDSVLGNHRRYMVALEKCYREMWQRWLRGESPV